jgi:hypothetical protein
MPSMMQLPVALSQGSSCSSYQQHQYQPSFAVRAANFLIHYYQERDLRAMSYEGVELTVQTILDEDRDQVALANSPMADGVDLTNIMAIQLMPRRFLNDTDRFEKHIIKAIIAVLTHLRVRHLITDQDIQDLVFNWEYSGVVVKLLGIDL